MSKKYYRDVILSNRVQCSKCNAIIESTHRHDFVSCSCGLTWVDGGLDYLRRCFSEEYPFSELSEVEQEEREPYPWEKE